MSDKPDDGGSAFPLPISHVTDGRAYVEYGLTGMSLRDYMAIHAPEKEISELQRAGPGILSASRYRNDYEARYAWADAMLAERKKP